MDNGIIKKNQNRFDTLKCCVLIPSYNNAYFLPDVLERTKKYTHNIIVVDDGSTDDTPTILGNENDIHKLSLERNRGKGFALRKGFDYALELGFDYCISMDSDGQHFPEDLPLFLDKLQDHRNEIIIGVRNMQKEGIPGKSSFGHKFSNFWVWFETGKKIQDTQSGYRLYPLKAINELKLYTNKYELEIEVLVKACWHNIGIEHVNVRVNYFSKSERISHFKPFKDFTRVSILNFLLVWAAIFYYRPINYIRKISWTTIRKFIRAEILMSKDTNLKISLSVFLGIFMGFAPVWGWQMVIAIFLAVLFRLNKVLVIVSANISLPPMIPFILYFSYVFGGYIMGSTQELENIKDIDFGFVRQNAVQYLVGAVSLGLLFAFFVSSLLYLILSVFRKR